MANVMMGSALSFKCLGVLVPMVAGRVLGILAWRVVKGRYRNTVALPAISSGVAAE